MEDSQLKAYTGGSMDGWARGVDNRRANFDLPVDTLRNAINCDILQSGKVRMRRGISQVIADANAHSVFGGDRFLMWATPTALKVCTEAFTPWTVLTDAKLADPISAYDVNGEIYFSNAKINGKITVDGLYEPWGIVPPSVPPTVTPLDVPQANTFNAAMLPTVGASTVPLNRKYQVTCVFVTASGEESGAPLGVQVTGGDMGYMKLTAIPQSSDSRVIATRIYVSDVDGSVFYSVLDVPTGVTTAYIQGPYGSGKQLKTQFLVNPPAGHLVDYTRGRIYIAVENRVYFTEPVGYNFVHPVFGYYEFPERVTLLKGTNDGLYVGSDITYFIDGDPRPMKTGGSSPVTQKPTLPYKAIEGAACNFVDSQDVMWLSERGVVLGKSGGDVKNLTEERIAMDSANRGCMGIVEVNGFKAAVAIMRDSKNSPFVADDYVEAEQDRVADLV